jgi:hypothetical protein
MCEMYQLRLIKGGARLVSDLFCVSLGVLELLTLRSERVFVSIERCQRVARETATNDLGPWLLSHCNDVRGGG